MKITAEDIIAAITSNMDPGPYPLKEIADTLEDGEALLYLGVEDKDQEAVEEASELISWLIETGAESWSPR